MICFEQICCLTGSLRPEGDGQGERESPENSGLLVPEIN